MAARASDHRDRLIGLGLIKGKGKDNDKGKDRDKSLGRFDLCDVCGGVPTRRCFGCPNVHRICDECSCEEWQQLCDAGPGGGCLDPSKGKGKGDSDDSGIGKGKGKKAKDKSDSDDSGEGSDDDS